MTDRIINWEYVIVCNGVKPVHDFLFQIFNIIFVVIFSQFQAIV